MTKEEAKVAWRLAYARCCRHDGIDPRATMAIFSKDNPYTKDVDQAAERYFALAGLDDGRTP